MRRERRRREARPREQRGQRIYVVADRPASHQRRLQRRRAAPHEGIVDALARRGETRDEKLGQLRLETGSIADLLQRMRLALAGGPEFIDEIGNAVLLELNCLGAEGVEAAQFGEEGVGSAVAMLGAARFVMTNADWRSARALIRPLANERAHLLPSQLGEGGDASTPSPT